MEETKNPMKAGRMNARARYLAATAAALTILITTPAAQAQTTPPDIEAISAACQALFHSPKTVSDMGKSQHDLIILRQCVDYGIDPPLRMRDNGGRGTSKGSGGNGRIPGRSCGPFTNCNYGAAVSNAGEGILNPIDDSRSFQNNLVPATSWSAPQFTGQLPADQMPEQLADGGTIYFYGEQCPQTPSSSLVVPNNSTNYYSTGSNSCLNSGHVMTTNIPEGGTVLDQQPVVMDRAGLVNWDDWGVVVLPDGFGPITVGGVTFVGGTPYFIKHGEDMYLPAGTKLYTMPGGSNTTGSGEGSPPIEYPPYDESKTLPLLNTTPPVVQIEWAGEDNPSNLPPATQWW